jgi:hypothetical protein
MRAAIACKKVEVVDELNWTDLNWKNWMPKWTPKWMPINLINLI